MQKSELNQSKNKWNGQTKRKFEQNWWIYIMSVFNIPNKGFYFWFYSYLTKNFSKWAIEREKNEGNVIFVVNLLYKLYKSGVEKCYLQPWKLF